MNNPDSLKSDNETQEGAVEQKIPLNLQENWNNARGNLENVADKLGYPIDEGIKEAVTSFIVNGYPTWGSCEGHLEKRFGKTIKLSPYVAVGQNEPEIRFVGEEGIKKNLGEGEDADKKFWDYIHENQVQETPEFLAIRERNENSQKEIGNLLDEFYKGRKTEGRKVTIRRIGPAGQFYVTTAAKQEDTGNEIKKEDTKKAKQELSQEQEEFVAFTEFMKKRYFGEGAMTPEEIQVRADELKEKEIQAGEDDSTNEASARQELESTFEHDEHDHAPEESQGDKDKLATEIIGRAKDASPKIQKIAKEWANGDLNRIEGIRNDLEHIIAGNPTGETGGFYSSLNAEEAGSLYQVLYGEKMKEESPEEKRVAGEEALQDIMAHRIPESARTETLAELVARFDKIREKRNFTPEERKAYDEGYRKKYAEEEAQRQKESEEQGRIAREEAEKREAEWQKAAQERRAEQDRQRAKEVHDKRWFGLGKFF